MTTELELDILRHAPEAHSQICLAKRLGFSVGKTHYMLNALIDKGLVKAVRFRKSDNKTAYRYVLTAEGIKLRIHLTEQFILRKKQEYEVLKKELQTLSKAQGQHDK
ncbi:MarR family EPS-associated transcriptional regulator [Achromobacter sp. F4_2707]|uniref:MarR family EPS-associated transcriptional regulator n=1 Tax=Achromobacter sp. F4_2707 TaxID=3114286 RepID=UPI0039C6730E